MKLQFKNAQIIRISVVILLITLFFGFQPPEGVFADTDTGTGPGGVESTDGTSNLVLWLDANNISGSDGSAVSSWSDKSGWGNDAAQASPDSQPSLQTAELNSQSTVRFDGTGDFLSILDDDSLDNTAGLTIFTVIKPETIDNSIRGVLSKRAGYQDNASYTLFFFNDTCISPNCLTVDIDNNTSANRYTSDPYTFTVNIPSQLSVFYDGSATSSELFVNATLRATKTISSSTIPNYTSSLTLGVMQEGHPHSYDGDIAEAIIFRKALNDAEHLLVENYLSSKYNLDISASGLDRYDGDTSGNGDFDFNVAGIGRGEADGTNTVAFSAGMIVENNTFLADAGDYVLFGHRTLTNDYTSNDLPWDMGTYPNARRWIRHWYIDETDIAATTGGTVDISFDFSDAGMTDSPIGDASNYKLLKRSGASGAFSEMGYAATIAGDRVIFTSVSISDLGSNFTLGNLDYGVSLTVNLDGDGSVVKDPDKTDYDYNDTVELTAIADPGWTFTGWSGDLTGSTNPDTIQITGNMVVTATFTQEYNVTVTIVGNGSVDN
ncbi:hypothetical protein KA005_01540, partial [bacterium]|nr:hypothetical protein [bacterium]